MAQARDQALPEPSLIGKIGSALVDFAGGAWDGVKSLSQFAWKIDPARIFVEPQDYFPDLVDVAKSVGYAVTHPALWADTFLGTQEWQQNPAHAFGRMLPAMLLGGVGETVHALEAADESAHPKQHYVIVDSQAYPEAAQHVREAQDGTSWRGDQPVNRV